MRLAPSAFAFTFLSSGRATRAGLKSCTILALLMLSFGLTGAIKAAESEEAGKPETGAGQPHKPTAEEFETWRQKMIHTPRPKAACYKANYPDTQWHEVPCELQAAQS